MRRTLNSGQARGPHERSYRRYENGRDGRVVSKMVEQRKAMHQNMAMCTWI